MFTRIMFLVYVIVGLAGAGILAGYYPSDKVALNWVFDAGGVMTTTLAFIVLRRRPKLKELRQLIWLGILILPIGITFTLGVQYLGVGFHYIVFYSTFILLNINKSKAGVISGLLSLVGLTLASGVHAGEIKLSPHVLYPITAAAITVWQLREIKKSTAPKLELNLISGFVALLITTPYLALKPEALIGLDIPVVLAFGGLFYLLGIFALEGYRRLAHTEVAIYLTLEIPAVNILARIILAETLDIGQFFGTILVTIACLITFMTSRE